ncbi:MAG: hypothetical protein ACRD0D_13920, partial [Acidimicrobiales bacterium]
MSKAFRRLEGLGLVARERSGSRARVILRIEDGSTDGYTHPAAKRERYLKLPHTYWEQGWHLRLSLRAKVMLLVALSLDDGFVMPAERAPAWYGVSSDTAQRGLAELCTQCVLDADLGHKKAPLAPRTAHRPARGSRRCANGRGGRMARRR